ncbi:hypothetical protein NL676_023784, partial [Syzygium grande]
DSLAGSGNNYFLATTVRVDSLPNGIDYLTHRLIGRFSNGLDLPDVSDILMLSVQVLMLSSSSAAVGPGV